VFINPCQTIQQRFNSLDRIWTHIQVKLQAWSWNQTVTQFWHDSSPFLIETGPVEVCVSHLHKIPKKTRRSPSFSDMAKLPLRIVTHCLSPVAIRSVSFLSHISPSLCSLFLPSESQCLCLSQPLCLWLHEHRHTGYCTSLVSRDFSEWVSRCRC
jgi:hypothetical protein